MPHHPIPDGPPVIRVVTHTDDPGIEARTLCLVDGYAAEIHHRVNTKHQEYNRHTLAVFDPSDMDWHEIIDWGFAEAGHVPLYPDADTQAMLRGLSEAMWAMANTVVGQSRKRQEQIDVDQYVDEHMAYQLELDRYLDGRIAAVEEHPVHTTIIDRGEIVISEDDAVAKRMDDEMISNAAGLTSDETEAEVKA